MYTSRVWQAGTSGSADARSEVITRREGDWGECREIDGYAGKIAGFKRGMGRSIGQPMAGQIARVSHLNSRRARTRDSNSSGGR